MLPEEGKYRTTWYNENLDAIVMREERMSNLYP